MQEVVAVDMSALQVQMGLPVLVVVVVVVQGLFRLQILLLLMELQVPLIQVVEEEVQRVALVVLEGLVVPES